MKLCQQVRLGLQHSNHYHQNVVCQYLVVPKEALMYVNIYCMCRSSYNFCVLDVIVWKKDVARACQQWP